MISLAFTSLQMIAMRANRDTRLPVRRRCTKRCSCTNSFNLKVRPCSLARSPGLHFQVLVHYTHPNSGHLQLPPSTASHALSTSIISHTAFSVTRAWLKSQASHSLAHDFSVLGYTAVMVVIMIQPASQACEDSPRSPV